MMARKHHKLASTFRTIHEYGSAFPDNGIQPQHHDNSQRLIKINQIVNRHGLIPLYSDFLNVSSYYLNPVSNFIWGVENIAAGNDEPILRKPSLQELQHIIQLNHLSTPIGQQPETLL
jgi:hypothetical protein